VTISPHLGIQPVAYLPDGLDVAGVRRIGLELLAQDQDEVVDCPGGAVETPAPDAVEDLLPGERPAR